MQVLRSARWLMLALLLSLFPAPSRAEVFISVGFAPPLMPVYEQPICPEPDLMWMPGYWGYGEDGYFWVPGAWVPAPYEGALWTPGYWGWNNGMYVFNDGYWGSQVGYYGGVDYGGGYMGMGFAGGEWRGRSFAYNTAVMNVNTTIIHNTYVNRTIVEQYRVPNPGHAAYSGGPGGVQHRPTQQEQAAARQPHMPPTRYQAQHISSAQADRASYAKVNGGHPKVLVAARPLPAEKHAAPAGMRPGGNVPARPGSRTAGELRPGARTNAPAERIAPATSNQRAAPVERTAPAYSNQRAAPAERTAPATSNQRAAPAERPAPMERPAPPQRAEPQQRAPVERPAPPQRAAPAPRAAPPQRPAPKEEKKPQGI